MATLKQRLHRKNSSGTYDTIHLETSADCITGTLAIAHGGTGATTAANARTNLGAAASSHNHSAANITSGTLSVARGGTGKASWSANRLIYASASTTLNQLAFPTTAGSVLCQGTSGAPYWRTPTQLIGNLGTLKHGVVTRVGTGEYQYFSYEITFPVEPILWWTTYLDSNGVDGGMINYVVAGKPSGNVNMSNSSAFSAIFSWSGNTLTVSTNRDNNIWWNSEGATYCFHYLY